MVRHAHVLLQTCVISEFSRAVHALDVAVVPGEVTLETQRRLETFNTPLAVEVEGFMGLRRVSI